MKSHPGLMKGDHLPDMDIKALREYIRIHIISLEQDLGIEGGVDDDLIKGAIHVSKHYLEVMEGYDD